MNASFSPLIKRHLPTKQNTLVANTALNMAAAFYEGGRGAGLTSKYPNAKEYARANFEKWIPKAVEQLTDMLARPDIAESMKEEIYDNLMEINNSVDLPVLRAK